MSLVFPKTVLVDLLNELTASTAKFDGAYMGLFQNNTLVTSATVLEDLTPADFTGYVVSDPISWNPAYGTSSGGAQVTGSTKQFAMGTGSVTNAIYGYYVLDSNDELLYAENFPQVKNVASEDDAVEVVPRITLGSPE